MNSNNFIHIRNYTQYSLSLGALRIQDLIKYCKTFKSPAIGISDFGNLFGSMEFSIECIKNGIQPIISCNIQIIEKGFYSGNLLLVASNKYGFQNLSRLVTFSFLKNKFSNKPWISIKQLFENCEGLICLSGGEDGFFKNNFKEFGIRKFEEISNKFQLKFRSNFFYEIQRNTKKEVNNYNTLLINQSIEKKIPMVATNENYFLNKDYYESHDALLCISQQTYIESENRKKISKENFIKSPTEMNDIFSDLPNVIENTLILAKKCSFFLEEVSPKLPKISTDYDENDFLKKNSRDGLNKKFKSNLIDEKNKTEYFQRLDFELDVITKMGYAGYFLIVADFIQWSKKNNIPVGPGRGSGAGSLVAWSLTITDLDPIKFGLLFERFLNPERISMPDFDIDFCMEKRDEVISYVQSKYNKDNVAQIITFGSFQARAALRDVGRVLQIPYDQVDKLCKLIPYNPSKPISLKQAISSDQKIKDSINNDKKIEKLFNISQKLEGLLRHASTHAAGVVISDKPLIKTLPLYRDQRSSFPVTQFSMKYVEKIGLVKFDFLGLKTLTVIDKTCKLLLKKNVRLDINSIPLNDVKTFDLIKAGKTIGVFQFDGKGMRETIIQIKPDRFEDLIAIVSLYRPGPMDNIPLYVKRKNSKEKIKYVHEDLKEILDETYGIMVYQEQVMQIAQKLAGFSLSKADLLRRAMGKKIKEEMDKQKMNFIDGCKDSNLSEKKAEKLFDEVEKFAGYGFNKSHAAAYALVSYQTAYLKAHFPLEFLCASMDYEINNIEKLSVFSKEIKNLGFKVFNPDINKSFESFKVLYDKNSAIGICYALGAIKNVGENSIKLLVNERNKNGEFKNLADLVTRIDNSVLNKRQLEYLLYSGSLNSIEPNQCFIEDNIEKIMKLNINAHKNFNKLQKNLFNESYSFDESELVSNKNHKEWKIVKKLNKEFESIGFYLSKHPVEYYEKNFKDKNYYKLNKIEDSLKKNTLNKTHKSLVIISNITFRKSKNGKRYAFFSISDETNEMEVICFSEALENINQLPKLGELCEITLNLISNQESNRFLLESLKIVNPENILSNSNILVELELDQLNLVKFEKFFESIKIGDNSIDFLVIDKKYKLSIKSNRKFSFNFNLINNLKEINGIREVKRIN